MPLTPEQRAMLLERMKQRRAPVQAQQPGQPPMPPANALRPPMRPGQAPMAPQMPAAAPAPLQGDVQVPTQTLPPSQSDIPETVEPLLDVAPEEGVSPEVDMAEEERKKKARALALQGLARGQAGEGEQITDAEATDLA